MGLRGEDLGDSATKRKFELLRKRAGQQATRAEQEAKTALKRRFAQLGNLPSGAAMKQEQLAGQRAAEMRQQALETVDIAEAEEASRRSAEERQKEFAREQREFAAGEALKGREFGRGEREAAQVFTAGQAEAQRAFQKQLSDKDFTFRENVFNVESGFKREQLDMAADEMRDNKFITAYNAFLQTKMGQENEQAQAQRLQDLIEALSESSPTEDGGMVINRTFENLKSKWNPETQRFEV